MNAASSPRATYRFDRFTLNLAHGVLRASDGTELPLRPKSFALLQLFVENAGHLLDRDSIMAAIWPDVFVTDDSITQCVGEIRRALGEVAPRLLQTLPRRGYRFTGEVACADAKTDDAAVQPQLAQERIEPPGSPPTVTGERRQLTVLFGDLVGSTALAERLDPEDVGEVLRAYQECCTAAIVRLGGHVARYLGDGVLAYFGYPRAQEDAAERAVRAGLAIVQATDRLPRPGPGPTLQVRVGIATGLVVSDLPGDGGWEEVTVGKPLHLADRLQALAEPGTVVIAEGTRRLVGELFALENLGRHRLKGFDSPVQAWRVTGEGAAESRFEALRGASLASLVGRRQELRLLLDRWEQAKEGEGQLVLLAGEAGIGKSRLVRALREELGKEPHTVLSHHGSPQHTNTALHPVVGYLERASGLRLEKAPEHQFARLEALLACPPEDGQDGACVLADLLGIAAGGQYPPLELSPQQKKERTFRVLLGHVTGLAARGPVLAIYEDAHWADPTTLEFLGRLVDRVQHLPVLVVVTFRPGFVPPWSGYGHATTLSLGRLGRRHTEAMIEQVGRGRTVPAAVREQILARTDGVPLFVEELTRMLLESGALRGKGDRYELQGPLSELAIPETLQDSLTARLDRLAPVKTVAQVAAVIGREFGYDLLAAAVDLGDDELRDALDRLIDAGLVFGRGDPPAASYAFKHALVRDAAYTGLVRARRQQLHARIAALLEERFPQLAASQPEMLAHHWSEAANPDKATTYRLGAGVRALRRSATAEAVAQLAMGIEMLRQVPTTPERQRRELDLQIAYGAALVAARGPAAPEPTAAYTRAKELCELLGEGQQLTQVLFGLWASHNVRDELRAAHAVATELLGLAKQERQDSARILGYRTLGTTLLLQGDFTASRTTLEKLLTSERSTDEAPNFPYDPWLTGQAYLSLSLLLLGYPEQALAQSNRSLAGAQEVGHHHTLALVLFCRCVLAQLCRDERDLGAHTTTLQAVAAERGFAFWLAAGEVFRGWLLTQAGDLSGGIAQMQAGLDAYRATGARGYVASMLGLLAEAYGRAGRLDEARALLLEAMAHVERTQARAGEAELHRLQGQLRLGLPRPDVAGAQAFFRRALEVARHQQAKWWELRAAISLAHLWAKGGEYGKARELLAPILGWFTERAGTPDLEEAKELLVTMG